MTLVIPLLRRAVLHVSGPDASNFLDGLLSNSILHLKDNHSCHAAMLTPQGKLLCELFVFRYGQDFQLDIPKTQSQALLKILSLYRLRAQLDILPRPDLQIWLHSQDAPPDPRSPALPSRHIGPASQNAPDPIALNACELDRILACAPEMDCDFAPNEVFPADINMDVMAGVDFNKGCFVGQEVVSRMKRRGTARRRSLALRVKGRAPATGSSVMQGAREIGRVTSNFGEYALAQLRIDKMPDGVDTALHIGGQDALCQIPSSLAAAFFAGGGGSSPSRLQGGRESCTASPKPPRRI